MRARLNIGLDLLRRGRTFLEAFQSLEVFDETTLAIIEAGEEIGKLPQALRSASQHLEKSSASKTLIFGAVTVTALDLIFAVGSIVGTRYGLIPELAKQGPGNVTPEEAEKFQSALAFATYGNDLMIWGTVALCVVLSVAVYAYFGRNESFRQRVDRLLLRIPVVRDLMLHSALSGTSGVMSSLLTGGVPFLQASLITSRGSRLPTVIGYWLKAKEGVEAGEPVSRTLAAEPLSRNEQMILQSHRDVQQLATSFQRIATDRDERAKKASRRFGIMAFVASLVYSGVSVLLTLFVVYIQNSSAMHGIGG